MKLFTPALIALSLTAFGSSGAQADDRSAVQKTYADIAEAVYQDSLTTAKSLDTAIDTLIASPSPESLSAAKAAWLAARVPYQQSEAFRFGNPIVDDWEGRVNAWPLDEGLIDYVSAGYGTVSDANDLYTANVIANPKLMVGGKPVDASVINAELLTGVLHEAGTVEANVATGYHAIEFLLWGQDLNGTDAGAGNRPYTDFDTANCTNGNCDRRAAYLSAASDLLIADLEEMVANWKDGGAARQEVTGGDADAGIARILTGMGSLSYGELAGERMKLGLLLHDPEEEHDCFSDNTHNSHYYDALGIQNVYLGSYKRTDGKIVSGASLSGLVAAKDAELDKALRAALDHTMTAMKAMKDRAEKTEAYDQMIGQGNEAGNAVVQAAIDGLIAQTRDIERAVRVLGLNGVTVEGSDSLDNVNAVFK